MRSTRMMLRAAVGIITVSLVVPATVLVGADAAGATPNHIHVTCVRTINGSLQNVERSFDLEALASAQADLNEVFTVTIPSTTTTLAATLGGVAVDTYSDVQTVYEVEDEPIFVPGSLAVAGDATINGNLAPVDAQVSGDMVLTVTVPGPILPGNW